MRISDVRHNGDFVDFADGTTGVVIHHDKEHIIVKAAKTKMKKEGWISFFLDGDRKIALGGTGMTPKIYASQEDAEDATGVGAPKPVRIEY